MFTGIIKNKGVIKKIKKQQGGTYFVIKTKNFLRGVKIGDSISCDGACLTVIKNLPASKAGKRDEFQVELIAETLKVTKFRNSKVGDLVNLELALKLGDRIDGHFVMGHVDGTGKISKIVKNNKNIDLIIDVPKELLRYFTRKGSVTINGVSLTIANVTNNKLKTCLTEYTLKETNLEKLKKGDLINIEIDMMARYLERLFESNK